MPFFKNVIEKLYETEGPNYMGSKRKLLPYIDNAINSLEIPITSVIDVFTGSSRVAQMFSKKGYITHSSDLEHFATTLSRCYTQQITKEQLDEVRYHIQQMNVLSPVEDWLTNNYGEVTSKEKNLHVAPFSKENCMKMDATRNYIESLSISNHQKSILLTSLILGAAKVQNTIGHFQAYMGTIGGQCRHPVKYIMPMLTKNVKGGQVLVGNAELLDYPRADIAYLDPPYTSMTYNTYYHLWESIVRWDKPEVALGTNRRIDRVKNSKEYDKNAESNFCNTQNAEQSFINVFNNLKNKVRYFILSYSSDSLVSKETLLHLCHTYGKTTSLEISHKRHIQSICGIGERTTKAADVLKEYLFICEIEK